MLAQNNIEYRVAEVPPLSCILKFFASVSTLLVADFCSVSTVNKRVNLTSHIGIPLWLLYVKVSFTVTILLHCNWVSAVNSVTVKWPVVMVCLYFVFGICYSFYFTECCFSKALVWPPLSGHCVSVWLMDAQLPDRLMATIVRLKGQWWILHFGQSGLGCFGRTLNCAHCGLTCAFVQLVPRYIKSQA